MEATTSQAQTARAGRRFREQSDEPGETFVEIGLTADAPLEVNMTDEPGGDPYNHTGRFKRNFR
jgi:hypothetical protein